MIRTLVAAAAAVSVLGGGTAALAAPPPARPTVRPGDEGRDVLYLEQRLRALKFAPGSVDGSYDDYTKYAVWSFQKSRGLKPRSTVGRRTWQALDRAKVTGRHRDGLFVDLGDQLLRIYKKRRLVLVTHVSTGSGRAYCGPSGCGVARTPVGSFRVTRKINGWRKAPLGEMFKPVYFHRGYAVHGSFTVPLKPRSHGCVRVPMNVSGLVFRLMRHGDRVVVHR